MEFSKIRKGLRVVLSMCQACNTYMQTNQIWEKTCLPERKKIVLAVLCNSIRILAGLFEPFIPGVSAIIYFFLGLERTIEDESFIKTLVEVDSKEYINFIPEGLAMNRPIPIFQKMTKEDIEKYRN